MDESVRRLDARGLKALAHPLRVRMLGTPRNDGPATATQLAQRLGESTGTTSWHLRQLAEHGFIEEDPERGTSGTAGGAPGPGPPSCRWPTSPTSPS